MSVQNSFYLAPLRGITDNIFRNSFEKYFGKFSSLLAPFIPTVKGISVCESHVKDILPDRNDCARLVPQIIGNDPEQFLVLASKIKTLGYESVNWNLGCPFPQITKKKRGSGLLPYPEIIDSFLNQVSRSLQCTLSVKVRLGLNSTSELLKIIPILNRYPLTEIIIHPRTGSQMYSGKVDIEMFEECAAICSHPVVYNGDIFSENDFLRLSTRMPYIKRWMIGRGIVLNPFLLKSLITGDQVKKERDLLFNFHQEIFDKNSKILFGPAHLLGKMKEIWMYLSSCFEDKDSILKQIRKTTTVPGYLEITNKMIKTAEFALNK
jgi:tRNA-dihydrouridine synthase B